MPRVHPTAVVDPRAELAADVEVGPYAIVGPGVRIGAGTRLLAHAVVLGPTALGAENVVHPFAVLGGEAQLKRHAPPRESRLSIGDRNTFREHVTVHRGTTPAEDGEGPTTRIGDDNLFMVSSHVAHDARIGSSCTFANGVQLAGHARIEDFVTMGGLAGVAQFVVVGQSAFVAAGSMCERRVFPFVIVQGDRARVRGLNVVGLERRGVPHESRARLRAAFREVFGKARVFSEALQAIPRGDPFVDAFLDALSASRADPRG